MNKNLEEKIIMYKLAMNFPTLKYEELEKIYWLIKGVSIAQENLKKENKKKINKKKVYKKTKGKNSFSQYFEIIVKAF